MATRLSGKTLLVTGTSRGIGYAVAPGKALMKDLLLDGWGEARFREA